MSSTHDFFSYENWDNNSSYLLNKYSLVRDELIISIYKGTMDKLGLGCWTVRERVQNTKCYDISYSLNKSTPWRVDRADKAVLSTVFNDNTWVSCCRRVRKQTYRVISSYATCLWQRGPFCSCGFVVQCVYIAKYTYIIPHPIPYMKHFPT